MQKKGALTVLLSNIWYYTLVEFLLQCECGLRVSDLQTLMRGEGEQDNGIIRVLTEKGEN